MERLAKIQPIFYFLLILSLFFPIRHVFYSNSAYQTGAYSDFTSFSLYLSDILIVALICLNFKLMWGKIRSHHVVSILITWILISFLAQFKWPLPLNIYFFLRFIELIGLYLLIAYNFRGLSSKILPLTLVGLGSLESILAVIQFLTQKSLGLYRLGESHLAANIDGVAKIVSHGTKFIRGYGTFPHANLLSAFLLVTILFILYFLFIYKQKWQKVLFSALLVLNIFGLTVSFSRAGIATVILIGFIYLCWLVFSRKAIKQAFYIFAISVIAITAAFISFHQLLFARATISDNAVKERIFYNHIGESIVKARPWQGIGFGSSVLHMQQFSPIPLQPWEIQPIHNYYILAAAEIGIVGAILFMFFFVWHVWKLFQRLKLNRRREDVDDYIYTLTLLAIICGFLILMLFDHYFYTIEQTQLLLWLILGLALANTGQTKPTYGILSGP